MMKTFPNLQDSGEHIYFKILKMMEHVHEDERNHDMKFIYLIKKLFIK